MLWHKGREAIFSEGLRPVATQREVYAPIVQATAKNMGRSDSRQNTAPSQLAFGERVLSSIGLPLR